MANAGSGLFNYLVLIGLTIGGVFLQIYLSKTRSRLPGLILPLITLGYSLSLFFGNAMFSANGLLVENSTTYFMGTVMPTIVYAVIIFIISIIPTGILLAIHFATRSKIKKDAGLQKMNVQEIE